MTIHKEGYQTIAISALMFVVLNLLSFYFLSYHIPWLAWLIFILSFIFFCFIISFFRVPKRQLTIDSSKIIAPADGKVVVIEETIDKEYFKDKRLQISCYVCPKRMP